MLVTTQLKEAKTMEFTLDNVKSQRRHCEDWQHELTSDDIQEIEDLLCHRCQSHTRRAVNRALSDLRSLPSKWFFERIYYDRGRWQYCAGQDYPSEIRDIRTTLAKWG